MGLIKSVLHSWIGWRAVKLYSVKYPPPPFLESFNHWLPREDLGRRKVCRSGYTSHTICCIYAHRLQPSYLRSNRKHRVLECRDPPVAPQGTSSSLDPWRRRAAGPRGHSAVSFVALWIFCSGTTPAWECSDGVKRVSWPQAPAQTAASACRFRRPSITPDPSGVMLRALQKCSL